MDRKDSMQTLWSTGRKLSFKVSMDMGLVGAQMPIAVAHQMASGGTVPASASIPDHAVDLAANPVPEAGCKAWVVVGQFKRRPMGHESGKPQHLIHIFVLQPCGPSSRPSKAPG
jgi:hypothetical protein